MPATRQPKLGTLIGPRDRKKTTAAALLRVGDPDGYIRAIAQAVAQGRCSPVPVLARDQSELRGFGPLRISHSDEPGPVPIAGSIGRIRDFLKDRKPQAPGKALCVAAGTPLCLAAAALLCLGTGKRFAPLPAEITPQRIAGLVRRYAPRSMIFVTPALLGPQILTLSPTRYLGSLIHALRACDDEIELPPFGIVTGVDEGAVTQLAAKSVLRQPIMDYYAGGEVCFVDEDAPPGGRSRRQEGAGMVRNPAAPAGVQTRPLSTLSRERMPRFAGSRRRMLVIKAHGRSYCAGKGLLCTARRITTKPEQPIESCVANFACVGPQFLQFDPRRFNARIMVVDACDAISLQADYWDWGNAAVGFLAAAGHPSAVLVGDGMVVPLGANGFEMLANSRRMHDDGTVGPTTQCNHTRAESCFELRSVR